METFIKISLIIHIACGCIALLAGLGAILLRNNTKKHRPFGKVYFWSMTVIFITAIYISIYRGNIFLFCIAFFTYYFCITSFRSLKLKKLHQGQKPTWFDWLIEIFFGTVHLGFSVLGIYLLYKQNTDYGIICTVFGIFGLRGNFINLKRLRGKLEYSNYWLLVHLGGMLGSYTGAITAFLVNNNGWLKLPNIVAWMGPALILVPLIFYEVNRFKKKATKLS